MIHFVICDNKTNELDKIINNKRKVLIRGHSSRRIPNSRIFVDDELYFVLKGENYSKYHAVVVDALSYSKLTKNEIDEIFDNYKDLLDLEKSEEEKWKKKCLCIIKFKDLKEIDEIKIPKYSSLCDWMMFESLEDLNKKGD